MKQRSCWRAECRGHGSLSAPMCPPWSYPWSWAMCNKSAFTAIQKRLQFFFASVAFLCPHSHPMLHTTRPASFTPLDLEADFVSHHSSCKRTCFTPIVLRASHHMSCKATCFTPLVLRASHHSSFKPTVLHTTHSASLHSSHHTSGRRFCFTPHTSCELHTTRPGSRFCFTPLVLQACRLHTTRPVSRFCFTPHVLRASLHTSCKPAFFTPHGLRDSHHTSWKPILFHTTRPAGLHALHHSYSYERKRCPPAHTLS